MLTLFSMLSANHLDWIKNLQCACVWKKVHMISLFPCEFTQVMSNQEAVDIARRIKDPLKAAKQLTTEALKRESKDDISCVVVRFRV